MNNKTTEDIITKLCKSPVDINEIEEYLVVTNDQSKEIINEKVKLIIDFLREHNPITEKNLINLFGKIEKDLLIMKHFNIINVRELSKNHLDNIITLNRNLRVIN